MILVLADANDFNFESVTGKRLCAQCTSEIVEIHRGNTRDFRHFRKCRVGGDEAVPVATCEFDKAAVHISCVESALFDRHIDARTRLHACDHVETAATTRTFRFVGAVRKALQLVDHALYDDERGIKRARVTNINDATIDDRTCVEQHRLDASIFSGELDVRDNEAKIVLRRHHDGDRDVAEDRADRNLREVDVNRSGGVLQLPGIHDGVEDRADGVRADKTKTEAEVDAEDRSESLVRSHRVDDDDDETDRARREREAEDQCEWIGLWLKRIDAACNDERWSHEHERHEEQSCCKQDESDALRAGCAATA